MSAHPLRSTLRSAAVCLCILALASACSGQTPPADASEPADLPVVDGVPQFEGPWAAELRRDYIDNDNEYWHKVIANGHISEREYEEHQNRLLSCIHDAGLKGASIENGYLTHPDDPALSDEEEKQIMTACDEQEAGVMFDIWFNNLRANPDNLDWQAGELECLIKYGLLKPGATKSDVHAWYEAEGNRQHPTEAHICSADPFGKLGLAQELTTQSGASTQH